MVLFVFIICIVCVIGAVAAVRLLRIEKGKAFVDLLNEKGNSSGENEMSYVERTLGFSIRCLDNRDIRLVKLHIPHVTLLFYSPTSICSRRFAP